MAANEQQIMRYQFASSVDLRAAFSVLEIEYLTVTQSRAITIYIQSVLNIETVEGSLENARIFDVEVLDHSSRVGSDDPNDLIETMVAQISDVVDVNFREIS
ncbi:hypothetical protein HT576_22990 [Haloterrigena sp. SYSU A121-1]|uniref:Uncharacterized protein n=1 Tax=Haloterrigena gelatinilytica TaxID=2741724 RepID=A0A8J8GR53_9EURY|nr:hypothetical protein [Haloterrigena gelatinilytica]NUB93843.1 hypothetical protein [Haloterrigena gelatinilytica]